MKLRFFIYLDFSFDNPIGFQQFRVIFYIIEKTFKVICQIVCDPDVFDLCNVLG